MLTDLRIDDFAIIDHLELHFDSGLITFTGETGAGKSIIIDAVGTLLGSRADTTMIRANADKAFVEGTFRIAPAVRAAVHAILAEEDLLDDQDYVTLGREIRNQGRSIARVNGRSVNLRILRAIGEHLVDVHGQSEHLSLLRVRQHLELLDRYAGNEDLLQAYREIYARLREVRSELERLRQSERDAARRVDLLGYQINEIESARLNPDEEEELRQERNRLANAESLASLTQEILLALDEGDPESPAATDLLGNAMNALGNLARTDPSQSELRDQAQTLFDQLGELGRDLRVYQEGIEFNPKRLSWVEERLDLIFNLKRKYGDSIEEVLTFCDNARDELKTIEGAEARIAELEKDEQELIVVLLKCGQKLSKARHKAAETLSKAIEGELDDLRMDQARFKVDFQHRLDPMGVLIEDDRRIAFDSTGLDQVEFLVAPNPGEGFKPLIKIASGGETSRLMLALKNVLARADQTPTLIFDEIDQGIGGRVGAIVGQKLWSLTRGGHQVMCITHLPQLAAFGEQHYQVQKDMVHGRTITQVALLDGDNRVYELAQMMGELSDGTVQSAKDILQTVQDTIA